MSLADPTAGLQYHLLEADTELDRARTAAGRLFEGKDDDDADEILRLCQADLAHLRNKVKRLREHGKAERGQGGGASSRSVEPDRRGPGHQVCGPRDTVAGD